MYNEKSNVKHINFLTKIYRKEKDIEQKRNIVKWICDLFNDIDLDEKTAVELYSFARDLERNKNTTTLDKLINTCRTSFCEGLKLSKYRSQKEFRTDFCLRHSIKCKDVLPEVEDCIAMLKSKDWSEKRRGAAILKQMNPKESVLAEEELLNALKTKDLARTAEVSSLHKDVIYILGKIKTKNNEAIKLLVKSLGSFEYKVPEESIKALAEIGVLAVNGLIAALDNEIDVVQSRAVKVLGIIGADAKKALPRLKELLKSGNRYLISIAQQAIDNIE